jgi:hypothetical protein
VPLQLITHGAAFYLLARSRAGAVHGTAAI